MALRKKMRAKRKRSIRRKAPASTCIMFVLFTLYLRGDASRKPTYSLSGSAFFALFSAFLRARTTIARFF